jgi:hypothetical protein
VTSENYPSNVTPTLMPSIERLRKVMQVNEVSASEFDRMREKVKLVVEEFCGGGLMPPPPAGYPSA